MHIYTDGACHPNPGVGGWGFHRSDGLQEFGGERNTTNNRMELTAILRAVMSIENGAEKVTIFSDSQYCVKGMTVWHPGWKRKGWRKNGEDMPNRDLWIEIDAAIKASGATIEFQWVRGHNGNSGNELADELAARGRSGALKGKGIETITAKPIEIATSKRGDIAMLESRIQRLEEIVEALLQR